MIGKWILIFGVVLIVVGAVVWLVESLGLPMRRLPGDIRMRGEGWTFHFPIVTCIAVSIVMTVVLNLLFWLWKRQMEQATPCFHKAWPFDGRRIPSPC